MRTLFLGSGPFGLPTLERLAELEPDLRVGTVPDAPRGRRSRPVPTPVKARACELSLECREFETLRGPAGADLIDWAGAELTIVADYRLLLPRRVLEAPPRGCFNLHGSVLPRWRGAAPVARGVLAGDREFGVTLYRMVAALDAGPVVASRVLRPETKLSTGELEAPLAEMAAELLAEWLPRLRTGEHELREQDEDQVTLAPKLTKEDGEIWWHAPAEQIENRVLAVQPWPRARCRRVVSKGQEESIEVLYIDNARALAGEHAARAPGEVAGSNGLLEVACGPDGRERIQLLRLQRPGKRSLPVAEFLAGTRFVVGDVLLSAREHAPTGAIPPEQS